MSDIRKTLGDRVRELRNRRHWKQGELAERSNLSQAEISKIETGNLPREPTKELIEILAKALEVSPEVLVSETPLSPSFDQAEALAINSRDSTPSVNPIKILLADADESMRTLLAEYLTKLGYEVFIAQNGREAIDIARLKKPDLIILEMALSGLDGLEVCRLLKDDPLTHDILIIFLSAKDDIDSKIRGLSAGANDYLAKPFSPRELEARVAATLRNKLPRAKLVPASTDMTQVKDAYRSSAVKARDPYRIIGTVLNGKYELIEYTGGGGMGAVYRAFRTRERDFVAVKILKPDVVARSPEYAELFEREAKNAQSLDHPHIVKVFDSDKDDDLSYMVMEWVEGSSIEDVVTQGQLSIPRITNIFEQVCSAIASAHKRGIIHLDLKPSNILLIEDEKPDDFVKVIDFGLSRVISKESGTTVTKFRGTHQYCAPEQFGGKVSHRSDIYSLGATLYHLITGVIPFGMSYINAKMHPNLELPEIPSLSRQRNVPLGLDRVIRNALNKNPELRQQSATQLFEEFKNALSADHKVLDPADIRLANLLQMETDMRRALERDEFILHYQPIVALDNFRVRGFEALVRWQHPERGFISPMDFIPVAEETGMIVPLGEWVMREACRQMHGWQKMFPLEHPLFITVNLSSKQFTQATLISTFAMILQETGVKPQSVKLEITESVVMENVDTATEMLRQLRSLGVKLAIDDFGTGYSSLSYLHRFPIDTLKIDRSFVTRMSENNENTEIVRTIVVLAQNLGMDVVAEGVETNEQLVLLQKLGCENGQGYFFSKPVNSDGAEKIIAETYGALTNTGYEVRKEEAQTVIESSQPLYKKAQRQALKAEDAVFKWLWQLHPNKVKYSEIRSHIDFIVELDDRTNQGVDVVFIREFSTASDRLKDRMRRLRQMFDEGRYSSLVLVLVAVESAVVSSVNDLVNDLHVDIPSLTIVVGRLSGDGEFIALRTASPV